MPCHRCGGRWRLAVEMSVELSDKETQEQADP